MSLKFITTLFLGKFQGGSGGGSKVVTDSASDTVNVTLADNNENRYTLSTGLVSLAISLPTTILNDFSSMITFRSGTTATTFTDITGVIFSGDDVVDDGNGRMIFTPVTDKVYNLMFYYDGFSVKCCVKGSIE
jgi:hypothetical protein